MQPVACGPILHTTIWQTDLSSPSPVLSSETGILERLVFHRILNSDSDKMPFVVYPGAGRDAVVEYKFPLQNLTRYV